MVVVRGEPVPSTPSMFEVQVSVAVIVDPEEPFARPVKVTLVAAATLAPFTGERISARKSGVVVGPVVVPGAEEPDALDAPPEEPRSEAPHPARATRTSMNVRIGPRRMMGGPRTRCAAS